MQIILDEYAKPVPRIDVINKKSLYINIWMPDDFSYVRCPR